jgi:hypothetical protein
MELQKLENIDSPIVAAHRHLLRCAEKLSYLKESKKSTMQQLLVARHELTKAQHKLWELDDDKEISTGRAD